MWIWFLIVAATAFALGWVGGVMRQARFTKELVDGYKAILARR